MGNDIQITATDLKSVHKWAWNNPVSVAEELFGIRLHSKQIELLEAFPIEKKISIRSGHKTSKSFTLAFLSLFWILFSPRGEGKVHLFANSHRQVQTILYAELQRFVRNAQQRGLRLPIEMSKNANLGVTMPGSISYIKGFSMEAAAQHLDSIAGASGEVLYVVDEASGMPHDVYNVMVASPSARMTLISNPLRKNGPFYETFGKKGWYNMHINSEEVAKENCVIGVNPIDGSVDYKFSAGVATEAYIEQCAQEHTRGGYFWQVRIMGNFAAFSSGFIPSDVIQEAVERDVSDSSPSECISIGLDTSWSGKPGADPTAMVARCGDQILWTWSAVGASAESIADAIRSRLVKGKDHFLYCDVTNNPALFDRVCELVGDELSNYVGLSFQRKPAPVSDPETGLSPCNLRCELYLRLKLWLMRSGSLKDVEPQLIEEVGVPALIQRMGKFDLTPKHEIRKIIGRSTNFSDALALSCFEYEV